MDSQNAASPKLDVYELVTNRIIELLEAGTVPWQKPWNDSGVPMNLMSKWPYRGINLWLLLALNYQQNLFLTWDQIKSVGGSVNKGQNGHIVVFWKPAQKKAEETEEKQRSVPLLRYYKVFNIAQCRDIPETLIPKIDTNYEKATPLMECEAIIHCMPDCPTILHKDPHAYYRVDTDTINMPKKKSFKSSQSYYSTLFHELVHSTGAEKRLGRTTLMDMVPFGAVSYAQEELIAEMGSAYLCHYAEILPNEINNTAAYLQNWLSVLKDDKRFIITASGQAQKAVDFILNKNSKEAHEETD